MMATTSPAAAAAAAAPRSLLEASLASAAAHPSAAGLSDPAALSLVSEDLLLRLLQLVLASGRLTPRIADAFSVAAKANRHAQLGAFIKGLRLKDPPPVVPTTARKWLGDAPGLY